MGASLRNNMSLQVYSEEFKNTAVQKLLSPGSLGLATTAEKMGIPRSTLFGWKQKYANPNSMKKTKNNLAINWTAEQKFEALIKTASMSENELGEYLRSQGLHSSDLDIFKKECLEGFKSRGRPKLDPEVVDLRKSKKELERSLKRTEKALAEQSARIILLKKSHEIWGVAEEDE